MSETKFEASTRWFLKRLFIKDPPFEKLFEQQSNNGLGATTKFREKQSNNRMDATTVLRLKYMTQAKKYAKRNNKSGQYA